MRSDIGAVLFLLLSLFLFPTRAAEAGRPGFYYTARGKESVKEISSKFGIATSAVASANRVSVDAEVKPGTRIWIPPRTDDQPTVRPKAPTVSRSSRPTHSTTSSAIPTPSRRVYVVREGDSLWKVGKLFGLTAEELARRNRLDPSSALTVGQTLQIDALPPPKTVDIPGGGVREVGSATKQTFAPSEPASSSSSKSGSSIQPSSQGFIWPAEGKIVRRYTMRADEKYMGIDIAVPKGTEVRAAKDGKVVYASDTIPFYGNMVIVSHSGKLASCYSQCDRLLVREGQQVRRGQVIARSGAGKGSEPNVHFEIRRDGEAVDPEPYLP